MSTNVLIKFLADTKQAVGEVKKLTAQQERLAKSAEGSSAGFTKMLGSLASGLGTFGLAVGGVEKGVRLMKSAFDVAKDAPGITERQAKAMGRLEESAISVGKNVKNAFAQVIAEMAYLLDRFMTFARAAAKVAGVGGKELTPEESKKLAVFEKQQFYVLEEYKQLKDFDDMAGHDPHQSFTPKELGGVEAAGDLWRKRREAKAEADRLLLQQFDLWDENNKAEIARRDALLEVEKRTRKALIDRQKKADADYMNLVERNNNDLVDRHTRAMADYLERQRAEFDRMVMMAGVKAEGADFFGMYGPSDRTRSVTSSDLDQQERAEDIADSSTAVGMATGAMQDAYSAGLSAALEGEAGIAKAAVRGAQMRLKVIALESGVQAIYWAAMYNWDKAARFAAAAVAAGAASTALGGVASMMGGGGGGRGGSGGYGQAGGGFVRGSSSGQGDGGGDIHVHVGEGFIGDPQSLAEEIDRKLRAGKRSGRVRDDSGPVAFKG